MDLARKRGAKGKSSMQASNTAQTKLAIFDFDGTLTEGHLWSGISRHHREQRVNRLAVFSYLLFHMPLYVGSKLKLVSDERNKKGWGQDIMVLFRGFTLDEGRKAFAWIADNYFQTRMRPEILAKLQQHKAEGCQTVVVSGMPVDFLEVVREKFGVDHVVGTRPEIRNSRYTGRIIPPLCFGQNKAKLLKEFIQRKDLQIDFAGSWSYADSIYDLPILEIVGNPVATFPDEKLRTLAESRGWPIIGEKSAS